MTDPADARLGSIRINRRQWLQCGAGGLALGLSGGVARAADKLSKSVVSYKDRSIGSKGCSTCAHYIRAAEPTGAGRCQIVAGPVGPHGYCILWSERDPIDGC